MYSSSVECATELGNKMNKGLDYYGSEHEELLFPGLPMTLFDAELN